MTLLLACGSTGPSGAWQDELEAARDRWASKGPANYTFRYTRHCFCPQLVLRVTVVDGQVSAIEDLEADTVYVAPLPDYSIPGLFHRVQDFIDLPVHTLSATYDPLNGMPLSVAADPIANAVDDENGFSVTEFAPLLP